MENTIIASISDTDFENLNDKNLYSELDINLYEELLKNVLHSEETIKESNSRDLINKDTEPKLERQFAFSDYDETLDLNEPIFKSLDFSYFNKESKHYNELDLKSKKNRNQDISNNKS